MIAVIEYVDPVKLFYEILTGDDKRDISLENWLLANDILDAVSDKYKEAFEFHLQEVFPRGTDRSEYRDYFFNHGKEIVDALKIDFEKK